MHNVNMPKRSCLLPKEIKQLKFENQLKYDSGILGVISQSFFESFRCLSTSVEFSRNSRNFANDRDLKLETSAENEPINVKPAICWEEIAAFLLKILFKNYKPVKSYKYIIM